MSDECLVGLSGDKWILMLTLMVAKGGKKNTSARAGQMVKCTHRRHSSTTIEAKETRRRTRLVWFRRREDFLLFGKCW